MNAKDCQNKLCDRLKQIFPGIPVQKEWDSCKYDPHISNHKDVYGPRLDIAVGPFNSYANLDCGIDGTATMKTHPFTHLLFQDRLEAGCKWNELWNSFSRCFLAIELEYSGSMKHILGGLINASVSGSIGLVITKNNHQAKANRLDNYLDRLESLGLLKLNTYANLFVFEEDEFFEFLTRVATFRR